MNDQTHSKNGRSCVLKVQTRHWSVLLTGDIDRQAEAWLVEHDAKSLKADILLAPHHGSRSSSSMIFVRAVSPKVVVFQVGYLNRYAHPHLQVIKRYEKIGAILLRTDQQGGLHFEITPKRIRIALYRLHAAPYWFKIET